MEKHNSPALRESLTTGRNVLDRIFGLPQLEQIVPKLQPELIHRVVQSCGLEDCGELVMLATPQQLAVIFDVDLWRSREPGKDEQFDAERFGLWLEVLSECDASLAAQKLRAMDADLVSAGIAQHARVFDIGCVSPFRTTDGEEWVHRRDRDDEITQDIGGYRLVQKRSDSWDAIVAVLIALDAEDRDAFHRIMRGCRALSNAGAEADELDDLLVAEEQAAFDLAVQRERRRTRLGYVTPAAARSFLIMSRTLQQSAPPVAAPFKAAPFDPMTSSTFGDILFDAGIETQHPRGLLASSNADNNTPLKLIRTQLQLVFERDETTYAKRSDELMYLSNVLLAGCPLQGRAFTPSEATEAALAVCNLALDHRTTSPENFLLTQDLVGVFQRGWRILYNDVVMFTAQRLLDVVAGLRCDDPYVQEGLDELRVELSKQIEAGAPWKAQESLDVLAILDTPAWNALLGCIAEFPVIVSPKASEFISEKSHIRVVREFMQRLPQALSG